jgi:integrase
MKRVHETTAFRIDDPSGYKKALRFAQDKSELATACRGFDRREAWGAWVEDFLRLNYAEGSRTLERYLGAWDWLRTFLTERKVATPAAVDYNLVLAYITWRTGQMRHCGKPISRNTALCDVKVWSVIMNEAVHRGFCQGNPCLRLGIRKVATKERPELKREEIETIREAVAKREGHLPLKERWMTVSFELALHQSIRLRATAMPLDRIDTEKRTITWQTKSRGGQERWVTKRLHANLVPLVEQLRREGATHTCVMPRMASKLWWELRKDLKLGHTTFHSTRVTVVTELARKGVSEQQAMAYVEHSSRIVHQIYQRLQAPDLAAAEAALDFAPARIPPTPLGRKPATPASPRTPGDGQASA